MSRAIPLVEIPDNGNLLGIGRPHGKIESRVLPDNGYRVRPQLFVKTKMRSFIEEIQIVVGNQAVIVVLDNGQLRPT